MPFIPKCLLFFDFKDKNKASQCLLELNKTAPELKIHEKYEGNGICILVS